MTFRSLIVLGAAAQLALLGQPAPDITNMCPTSATAGSNDLPLTITGTGFGQVVEVRWTVGGTTTVLRIIASTSGQQGQTLTVLVPRQLLTQPGAADISVTNVQQRVSVRDFVANPDQVQINAASTFTCQALNARTVTITNPQGVVLARNVDTGFAQDTTLIASIVPFPQNLDPFPQSITFTCTAEAPGQPSSSMQETVTPFFPGPRVNPPVRLSAVSAADGRRKANPTPFRILAPPLIRAASPVPVTAGVPISLTVDGANFIPPSAGCATSSQLLWNDIEVATSVTSDNRLTASIPASIVQPGRVRLNVRNPVNVLSEPFFLDVATPPEITTTFLPNGVVGRPYAATPVLATGGSAPLTYSINPDLGLTINPNTGVISGTPTREGFQEVIVSVMDAAQRPDRRAYVIRILPQVNLTVAGLAATISTEQQFVEVTIPQPYPAEIRGRLNFQFTKDPMVAGPANLQDPAQKFDNNFPTFNDPQFSILPGTTRVRAPFQPGTVAGTITVDVNNVSVDDTNVDVGVVRTSARIEPAPPTVQACIEQRSVGLLRVRMEGSSTTREIRRAEFRFTGRPGSTLEPTTLVQENGAQLFAPFYSPGPPAALGFGEFIYTQDFLVDGDVNDISSVTVVLQNAVGASAAVLASSSCSPI